jgi:hypothetical protein
MRTTIALRSSPVSLIGRQIQRVDSMPPADSESLKPLQMVLRQLREIKSLREASPGVFHCRGLVFVQFQVNDGVVIAELRKPGGRGFDRYAVGTAPGQRKLVDDAKRRAANVDDE